MCRDTLKNKDSPAKICGKIDTAEKYFLIKIQKPKKDLWEGTPHNLSKVSFEVKESEITSKYTAASKRSQIRLVKI